MKNVLRWALRAAIVIVVAALAFVVFIEIDGIPKYKAEKIDRKVEVTPERVARGKRFVGMLCAGCHMNPETNQLTGKRMSEAPPQFGVIYARNITGHPEKGIGKWSDGDLAFLIRTGLKPDGQYIPPYMAKLPHLSDDDLDAIIAFLRSDDEWVRPADVDVPRTQPSFLSKFLAHVAPGFKPFPYPKEKITAPPSSDKVAYGRYLVFALDCFSCHSADFKSVDSLDPEKSEGYMGGGNTLLDYGGRKIFSPNITFDEATGIGKWSPADFRRAVKEGFRKDGSLVLYPMARYVELADDDVDAMYAYLATTPKITKTRPPAEYEPPAGLSGGKAVYYKYRCDSCHGDTGLGACDLRQAGKKYPTPDALTAFLKRPTTVVPMSKMPPWEGVVKEDEYGPLGEYVRTLGK